MLGSDHCLLLFNGNSNLAQCDETLPLSIRPDNERARGSRKKNRAAFAGAGASSSISEDIARHDDANMASIDR